MKNYKISYIDQEDDLCHVIIEADSKENAKYELTHDYWDVKQIIQIKEQ